MRKQKSQVEKKMLELRNKLWPELDEGDLWKWKDSKGWINIPRTIPLISRIMDTLSTGKPVSSTYLDLWCRSHDSSL